MEPTNQHSANHNDELSLKDLILTIQDWVKYLFGRKFIIAICVLVGAALGFSYSLFQKKQYVASLSFVLEESKGSPLGNYAGIASQFGIDLGSGSGSGIFSGDNILEFMKSRLMVERALLSPVKGTSKSLAELFIQTNGIRESWDKNPAFKNIYFNGEADRSKFNVVQDSLLHTLYAKIVNANLSVSKPDKKLSFIVVKCTSRDERFSKYFTERLVKETTDFYVQTKTKRSKAMVDKLQAKADSIEYLLNRKTYSAAASQDLNLNPARSMASVGTELVNRDKMVLQTMYAEVVKNLEISRMSMSQETPIIQIVDTPILPLKMERIGKAKSIIIGGFLSGFIIVLVFTLIRVYKRIMS